MKALCSSVGLKSALSQAPHSLFIADDARVFFLKKHLFARTVLARYLCRYAGLHHVQGII